MLYEHLPFGAIPLYHSPGYYYDWNSKCFIESKRKAFILPMQTFSQPLVETIVRDVYQVAKSTNSDYEFRCVYNNVFMAISSRDSIEILNEMTIGFGLFEVSGQADFHIPFIFGKNKISKLIADVTKCGFKGKVKYE